MPLEESVRLGDKTETVVTGLYEVPVLNIGYYFQRLNKFIKINSHPRFSNNLMAFNNKNHNGIIFMVVNIIKPNFTTQYQLYYFWSLYKYFNTLYNNLYNIYTT